MAALLIPVFALLARPIHGGRRFYTDDPIQVEPETQDASRVVSRKIDLFYDMMLNHFARPGMPAGKRAETSTPSTRCRTPAGSPTAFWRGR